MGIDDSVAVTRLRDHRFRAACRLGWRNQIVLEFGYGADHGFQRVFGGWTGLIAATCNIHGLHAAFDHAAAVIRIENVEAGP